MIIQEPEHNNGNMLWVLLFVIFIAILLLIGLKT